MDVATVPGSFRDPSGFLFHRDQVLYRQVNPCYRDTYERLISSGFYRESVASGLLIAHEEVDADKLSRDGAYKIIQPQLVPFISYPYEWSFSQLKDAALLTLELQHRALAKDLSLKDASAYNIQFLDGKPIFIDTLSFEPYCKGSPWVAYRQFCQHFLAPLALMSHVDIRLSCLLRTSIDGIPLDLANSLLPHLKKWRVSLGIHISLHARSQQQYATLRNKKDMVKKAFPQKSFLGLLDSLRSAIDKLNWQPSGTEWVNYYSGNHNYTEAGLEEKEHLVATLLAEIAPQTVWDLGANTGRFSRIAVARGASVVAWDIDPGCVEQHYHQIVQQRETRILPLLLDLTNPSPGIGWEHTERLSFAERGPVDAILALGLLHHLAIANNIPLARIAAFLARLSQWLVLEFVPKEDSQVQKLLATRQDIFPTYTRHHFERAFADHFAIERAIQIPGTQRTLYCLQRKNRA